MALCICPPFDVISADEQQALHERSPANAIRIELAYDEGGDRYRHAAETLSRWKSQRTLIQDEPPAFYLYKQQFGHGEHRYTRRMLFARLRLAPWQAGQVLPHEQTFGGPKEDRLKLLEATRLNTSPVFLVYRDRSSGVKEALRHIVRTNGALDFAGLDGQHHALTRIDDPASLARLTELFAGETLYVADGHHRYETALGYRDRQRASASAWTGEEGDNFAMVALTAADDPGLLVLPIHRVTSVPAPLAEVLRRIETIFDVSRHASVRALEGVLTQTEAGAFGLVSAESQEVMLLRLRDTRAADQWLPQERSAEWRKLDYAIANHVILQHCLNIPERSMHDYSHVWFTEDAGKAEADVRGGKACHAVLLNPVSVQGVLDVADSGETMPQKSTFFYPKAPTGLVFNSLDG